MEGIVCFCPVRSDPLGLWRRGKEGKNRSPSSLTSSPDIATCLQVIRCISSERTCKPWTCGISLRPGRSFCKKPNLDTGQLPSHQWPLPLLALIQTAPGCCLCVHTSPKARTKNSAPASKELTNQHPWKPSRIGNFLSKNRRLKRAILWFLSLPRAFPHSYSSIFSKRVCFYSSELVNGGDFRQAREAELQTLLRSSFFFPLCSIINV